MRAYCIESFGSVDGIVLTSRDDPQPGSREILIRVRATSLNYRDLMVLKGGGRGSTRLAVVPLSDGAGEVVGLGAGASRFSIGDRSSLAFIRAGLAVRSSRIT
jgi:NADPH:quinone reductase-like Zn-dependent oxidoreductase